MSHPETDEINGIAQPRPIDLAHLKSLHPQVFDTWSRYEEVAIHFNDLLMRWRIQAIGGLVTLVTLAGFVVGDAPSEDTRYRAMIILAGTLLVAWVGVALIDLLYYRNLLDGAVDAIIELELAIIELRLSHAINARAKPAGKWLPIVFYICGGLPLLGIGSYATHQLCTLQREPSAAGMMTTRSNDAPFLAGNDLGCDMSQRCALAEPQTDLVRSE